MSNSIHTSQRLKSEKQIQHLFWKGKSLFVYPVKVQYFRQNAGEGEKGGLQFGVSVSKKHFKKAVTRNLLKRRMREAFRQQKEELETALMASSVKITLMFLFVAKEELSYDVIQEAIHQIVKRLVKKYR